MEFGNSHGPDFGRFCHRVIVIISDRHCTFTLHYTSILSNTLCQFLYDAVRADELDCRENREVDAGEEEYEDRSEKGKA